MRPPVRRPIFRRLECDPGDEAQVDFGTGAPSLGPDAKRRQTHVLRLVLSYSRKGQSEAVSPQTTDDFLRCLEDAFRHFGGVPRRLVLDNLKSGPPEYLARRVWVRWDARLVGVFKDRMEQVAEHLRREPGRFSTQPVHLASEKVSGVERDAAWPLARVRRLGPQSTQWVEGVVETRGVEAVRVQIGLLSLAGRHPAAAIERACGVASSSGVDHLMIRPLSHSGRFVHHAFQQQEILS